MLTLARPAHAKREASAVGLRSGCGVGMVKNVVPRDVCSGSTRQLAKLQVCVLVS